MLGIRIKKTRLEAICLIAKRYLKEAIVGNLFLRIHFFLAMIVGVAEFLIAYLAAPTILTFN